MSDLSDARDELQEAYEEAVGEKGFAIVNGKKVSCIIEEITSDEVLVSGGQAEAGGFRLSNIPIDSFSSIPEKGDPVTARGFELEVIGPVINRNNVSYEITCGSLVGEER